MDRRKFVVRAVSMSAALPLACDSQPLAPTDRSGPELALDAGTRYDVRSFGAAGDATHDDTAAFARALDGLPPEGGTLAVPAGVYLINPSRSIVLRDGVTLALHPQAVLKAIPVAESLSAVIQAVGARNIRITGGSIIGERTGHLGTSGEWGMGILIYGCNRVLIERVYTGDCWGDGIYVGPAIPSTGSESRNVVIRRCRSVNNRRQGLSITGCIGARIEDCEFSGTNGTLPQSGIDLEPDDTTDVVRDVRIARCRAVRNAGDGIMLVGHNVTHVVLENNVMSQNGLQGLFVRDSSRFVVHDNAIELNGRSGIGYERLVRESEISANVIASNSCEAPSAYDNVSVNSGSSDNLIAENDFTAAVSNLATAPRFDICIDSEDCVGNRLHGNFVRTDHSGAGGILDNGSKTEIVAPAGDAAERRNKRRYTPIAGPRSSRRFTPPVRGR